MFPQPTYNNNGSIDLSTSHSANCPQYLAGGVSSSSSLTEPTSTMPSSTSTSTATAAPLPAFSPSCDYIVVGSLVVQRLVSTSLFVLRLTHSFADVGYLAGCPVGVGSTINGMLVWYPTPTDFSTANGWPSSWTNMQLCTNMVAARISGTNRPSTDNRWYLDQVFTVLSSFLKNAGYSNITNYATTRRPRLARSSSA
jgi:hypothetical protein